MGNKRPPVPPEFLAMQEQAEAQGFLNGMDFCIWHVPAHMSSEFVAFGVDEDQHVIQYSDMGRDHELYRSPSFLDAKERFLEELARLTASRGRGKYAGQKVPSRRAGMTPEEVYQEMRREGRFK